METSFSGGSEEGDSQTLILLNNSNRVDDTTSVATTLFKDDPTPPGFWVLDTDFHRVTTADRTETGSSRFYRGSHNLGANGEAVDGEFSASSSTRRHGIDLTEFYAERHPYYYDETTGGQSSPEAGGVLGPLRKETISPTRPTTTFLTP